MNKFISNLFIIKGLIYNISILFTLCVFYSVVIKYRKKSFVYKLCMGFLFGLIAIIGMTVPFNYSSGIIYDGRSIVLTLAGLFGGLEIAMISSLWAGIYRIYFIGGQGALAGTATIVFCALTGAIFNKIKKVRPDKLKIVELYGIGLVSHVIMLLCQLLLPHDMAIPILKNIWLPVLTVYPVGTVLIGMLLRTEEKRIQLQGDLLENLNLLCMSQEIGNLGSWEYHIKEDKLIWSDQVYRIFGVNKDSYIPNFKNFIELVHPDDREKLIKRYENSISKKEKGYEIEHKIVVPNTKQIKIVYEKCIHIKDKDGNIVKSIGFVQDITKQKKIEQKLKEQEEKFRLLFYSYPDAVALNRLKDGTYIEVNKYFCDITGYRREEVIGKTSLELGIWVDPKERDDLINKLKENKVITNQEYRFRKKNNEIIYGLMSAAIININNEPYILNVTKDITEKKKIEHKLKKLTNNLEYMVQQRTKELDEANRELKEFAYSVSHDLKAPLRAIKGFTEIIYNRYRDELNEKSLHYFKNILEACDHMQKLIEDLLTYSRIVKQDNMNEVISVYDLICHIIENIKSGQDLGDVEIHIHEDLPKIVGSKTLLYQTFLNLIDNAFKYRRQDIKHRVEIRKKELDEYIAIEIIDNGIGIAPEYQDKIFNVFQRLHSQDQYPGTGIGLSIVKKAVTKMDSNIEVESSLNKGSVFRVKIPKSKCVA